MAEKEEFLPGLREELVEAARRVQPKALPEIVASLKDTALVPVLFLGSLAADVAIRPGSNLVANRMVNLHLDSRRFKTTGKLVVGGGTLHGDMYLESNFTRPAVNLDDETILSWNIRAVLMDEAVPQLTAMRSDVYGQIARFSNSPDTMHNNTLHIGQVIAAFFMATRPHNIE